MAKKEKHEKQKQNRRKKDASAPPGVALTYSPFTNSGKPLTSYREGYYEEQTKKRKELEAEREARRK